MPVDYDLVVIGNGENAFALAREAVQCKARVALVTQPDRLSREEIQQIAVQMRQRAIALENAEGLFPFSPGEWLNTSDRLESLQIEGVDVIPGTGQFRDRHTFVTEKRQLSSRAFAIVADPPRPERRIIDLDRSQYLTCDRLFELERLPRSLTVIGGDFTSCAVAQALSRLGVKVTMLVDSTHVLPEADVETARLLQAQLEVEGIEIYTSTRVTAIAAGETSRHKVWVGNSTMDCDCILLPTANTLPLAELNLLQAGVKMEGERIRVNARLQTTNRRIYACQSGADLDVILRNTLFLPIATVRSKPLPQAIATEPELATLGMTEIDARLQYGQNLYVLRQKLAGMGFCKILCRNNGEIVGAHIVGSNARELMETIAIAVHANIKIAQLASLSHAVPGLVTATATQFAAQKLARNLVKQSWLEKWFDLRRDCNI